RGADALLHVVGDGARARGRPASATILHPRQEEVHAARSGVKALTLCKNAVSTRPHATKDSDLRLWRLFDAREEYYLNQSGVRRGRTMVFTHGVTRGLGRAESALRNLAASGVSQRERDEGSGEQRWKSMLDWTCRSRRRRFAWSMTAARSCLKARCSRSRWLLPSSSGQRQGTRNVSVSRPVRPRLGFGTSSERWVCRCSASMLVMPRRR